MVFHWRPTTSEDVVRATYLGTLGPELDLNLGTGPSRSSCFIGNQSHHQMLYSLSKYVCVCPYMVGLAKSHHSSSPFDPKYFDRYLQ